MVCRKLAIRDANGIHLRPAAAIVDICTGFECTTTFINGVRKANGKSILELILLEAGYGCEVEVVTDGKDEEIAMITIAQLFDPIHETVLDPHGIAA